VETIRETASTIGSSVSGYLPTGGGSSSGGTSSGGGTDVDTSGGKNE
jgi:hypothetical protein